MRRAVKSKENFQIYLVKELLEDHFCLNETNKDKCNMRGKCRPSKPMDHQLMHSSLEICVGRCIADDDSEI